MEVFIRESNASVAESTGSSVSDEALDTEGLMAVKDIEILTGDNLDIMPLNIDLGSMRQFVHTPKEGFRVNMDTTTYMETLGDRGFLMFDPS